MYSGLVSLNSTAPFLCQLSINATWNEHLHTWHTISQTIAKAVVGLMLVSSRDRFDDEHNMLVTKLGMPCDL